MYGCHGKLLDKRRSRNPTRRFHPYYTSAPEIADFLNWCPADDVGLQGIYPDSLPWDLRVTGELSGWGRATTKVRNSTAHATHPTDGRTHSLLTCNQPLLAPRTVPRGARQQLGWTSRFDMAEVWQRSLIDGVNKRAAAAFCCCRCHRFLYNATMQSRAMRQMTKYAIYRAFLAPQPRLPGAEMRFVFCSIAAAAAAAAAPSTALRT